MPYDDIFLESEDKMDKALGVLTDELKGVRTGRATPGLVEPLRVEYYGSPTPIKQLATISVPDARMIILKPFDPSCLAEIEKSVLKSDLGLNPQNDGKVIRLVIPPLSEDRRKKLAKHVKELGEKAKVAVRNVRRDALKLAEDEEKSGTITEDQHFKIKEDITKMVQDREAKIDEQLDKKTKEVMEI